MFLPRAGTRKACKGQASREATVASGGAAAIALSLLAWQASGRSGFVFMAAGWLALLPAWSFRPVTPLSPERAGAASPGWAKSLVGPGVFLIAAGLFQILAR